MQFVTINVHSDILRIPTKYIIIIVTRLELKNDTQVQYT